MLAISDFPLGVNFRLFPFPEADRVFFFRGGDPGFRLVFDNSIDGSGIGRKSFEGEANVREKIAEGGGRGEAGRGLGRLEDRSDRKVAS